MYQPTYKVLMFSLSMFYLQLKNCARQSRGSDPVGTQLVNPLESLLNKSHRLHWPVNVSKSKTNQQKRGF